MKLIKFAAMSVILFLFGCGATSLTFDPKPLPSEYQLNNIAIVVVPSENFPSARIENIAIQAMSEKNYLVAGRADLDRVLNEIVIQRNQITERDASRLGKILNVDAIFIIEMTDYEATASSEDTDYISKLTVVGRLIDVETSLVVWIENATFSRSNLFTLVADLPKLFIDSFDRVMAQILGKFPVNA